MPTWAFVSLLFAALLTLWTAVGFYFLWQEYDLVKVGLSGTHDVVRKNSGA